MARILGLAQHAMRYNECLFIRFRDFLHAQGVPEYRLVVAI